MNLSESDLSFILTLLYSELRRVKHNKNTLYVLKLSKTEKSRRISDYETRINYIQYLIDKLH